MRPLSGVLGLRATIMAGVALVLLLGGISVVVFQDALMRSLLNPRTPFQIQLPPAAPDYRTAEAWALRPTSAGDEALAAIFYIHSTTFYSSAGWNAPIDDEEADEYLRQAALPNEAGPFLELGPIWAPRYRQATLFATFTHQYDGVAARKTAYRDVRQAFETFLRDVDPKTPIVLAGYGQGGLHALGILKDYFQTDKDLRARLAAAYIIGQAAPLDIFEGVLSNLRACESPSDYRCVVSYADFEPQFDEEMRRVRDRSMMWTTSGDLVATKGKEMLCINPLSWTRTDEQVGPERHKGAASATGLKFGEIPPPIVRAVGAQCVDGALVVDRPRQEFLRRDDWFGAKWRSPHFNLFYFDLSEDARRRTDAVRAKLAEEAQFLDPIEQSVEIEPSPINKVPKP